MSLTLLAHILTATITLSLCVFAWWQPTKQFRTILHFFTLLSVGSGFLLTLDPTVLTRAFCIKLGVYLLMIFLTQVRLSLHSAKI